MDPEQYLAETTMWRLFKRDGLMEREPAPTDRRRYEAELPNDIWQSDVMHGPLVLVSSKKRKAYLIAFIDDMSRLICHAQFYLSEKLDAYLDALRQALLARGLPRKLYVDNGPAFRSLHLQQICASLGIAPVHSKPYQPQGRGKIERWFRGVRTDFLPGFRDDTLEDLNEVLGAWLRDVYHIVAKSHLEGSPQAVTAIQQGSAGLLRKANHLARGALIAAANEKCQQVSAEHVRLAATELV